MQSASSSSQIAWRGQWRWLHWCWLSAMPLLPLPSLFPFAHPSLPPPPPSPLWRLLSLGTLVVLLMVYPPGRSTNSSTSSAYLLSSGNFNVIYKFGIRLIIGLKRSWEVVGVSAKGDRKRKVHGKLILCIGFIATTHSKDWLACLWARNWTVEVFKPFECSTLERSSFIIV